MSDTVSKLKWAFYQWLGALSIQEVMTNSTLMECVKRVERLMLRSNAQQPINFGEKA